VANIEESSVGRDRGDVLAHEFHSVVLLRIMRGGDDDAARVVVSADCEIEHVGGDLTDVDDVNAGVHETLSESFLQRWRGETSVHADDDGRWLEQVNVSFCDP